MYLAFISSVYESLLDERQEAMDSLLDLNIFPVCMEHFTVSSSRRFEDICDKIDSSDIFILILGGEYGSCDKKDGISWTQKEYEYAISREMPVICIKTGELKELFDKPTDTLSESQKKQLEFANSVEFGRWVTDSMPIVRIISQAISDIDPSMLVGWTRNLGAKKLEAWRNEHRHLRLEGSWYHFHISDLDPKYIRLGTLMITQSFDPDGWREVHIQGTNYNPKFPSDNTVDIDRFKRTTWEGSYKLDEDGRLIGIFDANRAFEGGFGDSVASRGHKRGIHEFFINTPSGTETTAFEGTFHDQAPSPKTGIIYAFKSKEERDELLLSYRENNS